VQPIYLKEQDVEQLASVPEVIDVLEAAFRQQSRGEAFTVPRQRLRMPGATLHLLAGAVPGYFGYKAYTAAASGVRFLFYLYQASTTDLVAMMEADALGQIRTGAATGLATRLLSNLDAKEAVLFGAGWQAESQLLAMTAVRKLSRVWIVNRSAARREVFITKMQPLVEAKLIPAASAEKAVRESHIVTTITNSREPVLKGEWLQPGQHINAAGGNSLLRSELDEAAVLRADRLVVDSIDQARLEAGEFLAPIEGGGRRWQDFIELRQLFGDHPGRRSPAEITLFKSLGIALEDVAIGKLIYERALERGLGRPLRL
jgi:ornithine cyclodeaminase/alanine dehydrogenase-like protein (mu-crystallin family)